MPRTSRAIVANYCYHLINRGNNQQRLFHDRYDYTAFLWLIAEAHDHAPLPIIGACLMPNHVHFLVRPTDDEQVARWTHWLFTTHARRYHRKYESCGRVWQGRFKAFPIQEDTHLLTVLRYVERNALTARLAPTAEGWEWGSLNWRLRRSAPIALEAPPAALPSNWTAYVNEPQTPAEVAAIRASIDRQSPFGAADWTARIAIELGLEQTLAPLGRPRQAIVTTK
jgi:putative transposase